MSIRRAASCAQPRQVSSGPRGARTGRGPDMLPSLLPQAGDELLAEAAVRRRGDRHEEVVAQVRRGRSALRHCRRRRRPSGRPTWRRLVAATPPAGSQAACVVGRRATGRRSRRRTARPEPHDARDREVVARRGHDRGRSRWPRRPTPGPATAAMLADVSASASTGEAVDRRRAGDRAATGRPRRRPRPRRSPTGSARVTARRPMSPASARRSASGPRRSRQAPRTHRRRHRTP